MRELRALIILIALSTATMLFVAAWGFTIGLGLGIVLIIFHDVLYLIWQAIERR